MRLILAIVFLSISFESYSGTIVVSGDSNMGNGLNPATPWVVPGTTPQLFINVLGGGSSVFIDPSLHPNVSVVDANADIFAFYNAMPGVTTQMPGGNFDTSLGGVDLLISVLPTSPYSQGELDAIQSLLNDGGTVFFLGENGNFSVENQYINDALTYLGSTILLTNAVISGFPISTDSVNGAHPLMSGVTNIGLGTAGSTSGGTALAFKNSYTVLALEEISSTPVHSCIGFESPLDDGAVKVKKNRVIPHKAQLLDDFGAPLSNLDIAAPPVIQVIFDDGVLPASDVTDDALSAGAGTDGNQFEFLDGKWQFNLKTKNYSAQGTYTTTISSGDTGEYAIQSPYCIGVFVVN